MENSSEMKNFVEKCIEKKSRARKFTFATCHPCQKRVLTECLLLERKCLFFLSDFFFLPYQGNMFEGVRQNEKWKFITLWRYRRAPFDMECERCADRSCVPYYCNLRIVVALWARKSLEAPDPSRSCRITWQTFEEKINIWRGREMSVCVAGIDGNSRVGRWRQQGRTCDERFSIFSDSRRYPLMWTDGD